MSQAAGAGADAGSAAGNVAGAAGSAAGNVAGAAGNSAGGVANGASNVYGALLNAATDTGQAVGNAAGPTMGNAAAQGGVTAASQNPAWYQPIVSAIQNYSKGASGNLGDAIGSAQKGDYMQTAGYLGGKVGDMMKGGGGSQPAAQIKLPDPPQQQDPMSRYAQLYEKYRSQYG